MKKYFTLIELIVVIAIIAILACLILPSLSSAKETAKSVNCMSNLKQISLGIHSYMDDNTGYGISEFNTINRIKTYFPAQLYTYLNSKNIWKCPSEINFHKSPYISKTKSKSNSNIENDWEITYGLNLTKSSNNYKDIPNYLQLVYNYPIYKAPDPQNTIYIGDNVITDSNDFTIGPGLSFTALNRLSRDAFIENKSEIAINNTEWPHINKANLLMIAGNVINIEQHKTQRYMWTVIAD